MEFNFPFTQTWTKHDKFLYAQIQCTLFLWPSSLSVFLSPPTSSFFDSGKISHIPSNPKTPETPTQGEQTKAVLHLNCILSQSPLTVVERKEKIKKMKKIRRRVVELETVRSTDSFLPTDTPREEIETPRSDKEVELETVHSTDSFLPPKEKDEDTEKRDSNIV